MHRTHSDRRNPIRHIVVIAEIAAPIASTRASQVGDWRDVPPEDARENEVSVRHSFRIISSYRMAGERLWVIAEQDRSATTLLLPSE